MADVSPGGTPDQAAPPPPAPEFPASSTPASPGHPAEPDQSAALAPGGPSPHLLAAERRKTGWRRWLPIAGVISFLLAGAIGMLLFLGVDIGIVGLSIGLGAAVLPVPLLVASFLWLDRYEPEPIRYLAFCFAWGAAIATAVALCVNTGASWLFDKIGLPDALVAVLVAPFIEESMKALGPILLFWRRRPEWSGITDGIVYCGLSALGFAMVENVLYLGKHGYEAGVEQYGPATGLQNLFAIFIVRILFTGFAHPLFTSMTGIGLGIASRSGDRRVRWLAPVAGLLLAMMLHGTFNLLPTLSVSLAQPFIMLYGYLGFMVPFFFAVVGFAIALRSWEGRLTERILPYYVRAGWFAPPEVAALGSLGRRHSARQWARRVAGPPGQKAMRSFQFAATQLALLRDGMQRGLDRKPAAVQRAAAEEQRLLGSIVGYRSVFAGRDPQTPPAFWDGANYQIAFPDGVTRTVAPPAEPVVPVPIRFAPQAHPFYAGSYGGGSYGGGGYGGGGYGGGYGDSGYGPPGYGVRSAAPAYGPPAAGYGAPAPAYGPPANAYGPSAPGYGAPAPAPAYGAPASAVPSYRPTGYAPPSYGGDPAYGAPNYPAQPAYGPPPTYGPPGYTAPDYGNGGPAGNGGGPGNGGSPGNGGPPIYPPAAGEPGRPSGS